MTYKFTVSTTIPLALTDFDEGLATTASLNLGTVLLEPEGQLNEEQIEAATASITTAIKAAIGVDATVSHTAIES